VDKGAGLLFVPGRQPHKHDSLISRVRATHGDAVGVAHRLDRDTSGVCVLAKTKAALRALSIQFQERRVTKTYVGAVAGVPDVEGVIDEAIGKVMTAEGHHRVALLSEAAGGRAASTKYRVLDTASDSSLLELAPRTGRAHQLRVHLAAIGHPLLGDALHGGAAHERLCLHSAKLAFEHPSSKVPVAFESPAPFDATGGPPPR
jgi:tRNA pseudouridine32 synthase/23S rRNA pseudouridine746 synthase